MFFRRYLYYITLSIPKCFSPQGVIMRELVQNTVSTCVEYVSCLEDTVQGIHKRMARYKLNKPYTPHHSFVYALYIKIPVRLHNYSTKICLRFTTRFFYTMLIVYKGGNLVLCNIIWYQLSDYDQLWIETCSNTQCYNKYNIQGRTLCILLVQSCEVVDIARNELFKVCLYVLVYIWYKHAHGRTHKFIQQLVFDVLGLRQKSLDRFCSLSLQ